MSLQLSWHTDAGMPDAGSGGGGDSEGGVGRTGG